LPKVKGVCLGAVFLSLISVYLLIVLGFAAKASLKEKLDERTLVLVSIYFLQPMLNFWGLMRAPIDHTLIAAPLYYLVVIFALLPLLYFLGKKLFAHGKERAIFIVSGLVGNTANLGIPIGIALFGEASIPYTTIINIANVFFVYTVGVYFYSRGNFSVKESLLNVIKLPVLWFALLAIVCNLIGITIHPAIDRVLEMGAYASITIQLMIFGIYLHGVRMERINARLIAGVTLVKFLLLPAATLLLLWFIPLPPMVKGILFLELIMPLAIANVNFAALYDCKPRDLTVLVLLTTLLFMGLMFAVVDLLGRFGWH